MDSIDFIALAQQCAPAVHHKTMAALVKTESTYNPFAIGVVGGRLVRQPRNKGEAMATANSLMQKGWKFSAGIAQVYVMNFSKYGLNLSNVFDPCVNLRAGSAILVDCFKRAMVTQRNDQQAAVRSAFSCYYSGNFTTGFKEGYVQTVVANSANFTAANIKGSVPSSATAIEVVSYAPKKNYVNTSGK